MLRSSSRSSTCAASLMPVAMIDSLADPRQRIAHEHVDDAAAAVARGHQDRAGGLFADLADDPALRRRPESAAERSSAISAYSGATTARNCPSLAMCSGSRPSSSQAPRTASRTGNRFFDRYDPKAAIARQFVE